jgi:hypothetical protein
MSKTPEEMAIRYSDLREFTDRRLDYKAKMLLEQGFLAGYKAAQQWISVKDRLPEGCDPGGDCDYEIKDYPYVLAYSPTDGIHVAYYDTHRGVFETSATTSAYAEELYKVTHWQPLPAAPKEEK